MQALIGRPPAAVASFLLMFGVSCLFAEFKAGSAKRVITPDLAKFSPVYLAGFDNNRVAKGIHDDLYARCMALSNGKTPLVLCGVDSIGLFLDDTRKARDLVQAELKTPVNLVVAALHDHEAPDTMGLWGPSPGESGINEAYNAFVVERVAQAAVDAVQSMRQATARVVTLEDPELDSFISDNRPPVVHDSDLVVMAVSNTEGKIVGALVNWANHPETLGSRNTLITADYPANLYRRLENLMGGTAVFVNGAVGGMQSPLGTSIVDTRTGQTLESDSFQKADMIGRRIAEMAVAAIHKQRGSDLIDKIEFVEREVRIPLANKGFQQASEAGLFKGRKAPNPGGTSTTVVGFARLSGGGKTRLEIAMVPGELYPELSVGGVVRYEGADFPDAPVEPAIKSLMKAPHKMLFGLANDEIGYIIPKAEWDEVSPWLQNAPKRWYGEVNSAGPETAPLLIQALRDLIEGK